jgi:hypothetical protein
MSIELLSLERCVELLACSLERVDELLRVGELRLDGAATGERAAQSAEGADRHPARVTNGL